MQVAPKKIVATGPETRATAEYLWTTCSLCLSGHLNRWVAEFLRREFLPSPAPAYATKRSYISRADAVRRQEANGPEVIARLKRLGFRTVIPGQLPVVEQAQVFAAAVVVAPHGAGLTHLVFAPPSHGLLGIEQRLPIGLGSANDLQGFRVPMADLNALLEIAGVR